MLSSLGPLNNVLWRTFFRLNPLPLRSSKLLPRDSSEESQETVSMAVDCWIFRQRKQHVARAPLFKTKTGRLFCVFFCMCNFQGFWLVQKNKLPKKMDGTTLIMDLSKIFTQFLLLAQQWGNLTLWIAHFWMAGLHNLATRRILVAPKAPKDSTAPPCKAILYNYTYFL